MGYGRQISFGEDPNRWNFNRDRDFRTLAATVYQSDSKKIENHIGAIWNFIHYYNAEIAPKLAITTD